MKGMLRGKKKKEACEKDPPELCVDGQPFSNPSTPQEIIDRRNTGPSNDEALVSHRNSMFNMLLGRNKIINAITGSSLTAVSTAPSPLGSSAPASYPSNRQAAPEPPAVTLVRRTSNRLLNSTRFSSYETLRSTYDASDPLNNQFSRSTEDLALDENSDVYAGPLIPSVSDPGAYRNIPGHDTGSHPDANDPYIRRRQQQPHTFYGHDASSSSSNDITGYGVTINGHPLIAGDGTAMTHQQPITNLSGYLAKKTDFRGGWKVYEATMRGGKLYFYKPASQAARHQVSDTDGKGMALQVADFDPAASAFLFEPSNGTEVKSMRFRRYACVLLFEGRIVICRRKWIRSSRAQASAILLSDDENANGYYTKWKIDDTYPIQHVEVMEAASTGFDSQSP
ncbi:hypothetical protein BDF22DRAFT_744933 [Syncephalis plumigaleata]|nr:hypothetical protein BDF22DRAFT_744933 [Syncephalis plumigaleata]